MNFSNIKFNDIADGPGVRTSVFVSGCRRHCPFCFNREAQNFNNGALFDEAAIQSILDSLEAPYVSGLTVLGGEPMEPENQPGVLDLLQRVREKQPNCSLWLYSGFTYEELVGEIEVQPPYKISPLTESTAGILNLIDVLVDGPFLQDLYDIRLRFRGSSNQRILDMKKSLREGKPCLFEFDERLSRPTAL